MTYPVFDAFKSVIATARDVHDTRLKLADLGNLQTQYSVFDYVNESARIVIMGITPGELQANEALKTARNALKAGLPDAEIVKRSKVAASFAGAMRNNLVSLMDYVGISAGLGLASAATLWGKDSEYVHFTSALRYPVFVNGSNYTGGNPKIDASQFLRDQVLQYTGQELRKLPSALLIPLGPTATMAAQIIVGEGAFPKENVLLGVPHPSGANAERIAFFLGRKNRDLLTVKTNPEKIDRDRAVARATVSQFFG